MIALITELCARAGARCLATQPKPVAAAGRTYVEREGRDRAGGVSQSGVLAHVAPSVRKRPMRTRHPNPTKNCLQVRSVADLEEASARWRSTIQTYTIVVLASQAILFGWPEATFPV